MHISGWPRGSLDKNVTRLWLTNEQYYGEKKKVSPILVSREASQLAKVYLL